MDAENRFSFIQIFGTIQTNSVKLIFDGPGIWHKRFSVKVIWQNDWQFVAMSVLLYRAPIWADTIDIKEYQRTEIVLAQWTAVSRWVSTYHTVSTEAVCVLAGILPIEIATDECRRVYSATHPIDVESGKVLCVRCDERQATLHKWEEWLSGSSIHEFEMR